MNNFKLILSFAFLVLLVSCSKNERGVALEDASSPGFFDSDSSSPSGSIAEGSNSNSSGLITAGEWNDLENWTYWTDSLLNGEDYAAMPEVWGMYPKSRVSVIVEHTFGPAIDIEVELRKNGTSVWENRTDNKGKAELWIDLFDSGIAADLSDYSLYVDGSFYTNNLVLFEDGVNHVNLFFFPNDNLSKVDLAFIVDATGSMGDEIDFLKSDLKDVIQRVENDNSSLDITTGTVFYRDEGDEYLVKHSPFTDNIDNTIDFIGNQYASGGGDFPEAVHTAVHEAITTLNWSDEARTRIAFLLLDAPPHKREEVISSLHTSILKAAQLGIKLIPITASGVDKETEFLMRFFSTATNSTYVFITNDSGIGNNHIEASVGEYEVEFLNDLMVRLIAQYTD